MVHRDPYSQRRELTRHTSWVQMQHEVKQGNFCDWRRDQKARTSCFSCNAWVCKECSSLACPDCKPSVNSGTVVSLTQQWFSWPIDKWRQWMTTFCFLSSASCWTNSPALQQFARIVSLFFVAIKIVLISSFFLSLIVSPCVLQIPDYK